MFLRTPALRASVKAAQLGRERSKVNLSTPLSQFCYMKRNLRAKFIVCGAFRKKRTGSAVKGNGKKIAVLRNV